MLTFQAHAKAVCAVAFAPDGRHLATSSAREPVRLWHLDGPNEVKQFPGNEFDSVSDFDPVVAFSPDGRFLARGGWDFALFEVETGRRVAESEEWSRGVAFAPDGKEVATCSPLERWSLPKGKPLPGGWGERPTRRGKWRMTTGPVAYSPDNHVIATAFTARTDGQFRRGILLWDRKTGESRGELVAAFTRAGAAALTYSPDGAVLAGVYDARVGVLDAATGAAVAVLKAGAKHVKGIAFAPDGRRLVAVSNDAVARVYDTATWAEASGYEWAVGRLTAVAVAPDGLRAACGSDRGRVVVWDLD